MIVLKGKPIFGGITKGKIIFFHKKETVVSKCEVKDPQFEIDKYESAKRCALEEIQKLYDCTFENLGREDAGIFLIQQMILGDIDFDNAVKEIILSEGLNADFAVAQTVRNYSTMLGKIDSEYIKSRSADLKDICDRLIKHILHLSGNKFKLTEKAIVCAEDLVPSETMGLDRKNVLALCTKYGSANSHAAILARTMNIPAITGIGCGLTEDFNGKTAIADGYDGTLYIEPDEKTVKRLFEKEEKEAKKRELLRRLKGRKNITLDKTEIKIFANISGLSDVDSVIENDAGGIGLFRSEFLYLENDCFPNEEQQFFNYRRVLERMQGKPVVVRTLDLGADKSIDYFGLPQEKNPALGFRSVRICLNDPDMFKTQLRALLRASVYGNLSILIPMIIDIEEIRQVKELINQAKKELDLRMQDYSNNIKLGIMIETPAAVMLSDLLAKEVDFFSIGTNDLEQYTLAADRQNSMIDCTLPHHHTALLRMINMVCINAHREGIPVGICGELGADCSLTEAFLAIGIDEISVNPSNILALRSKIRTLNLSCKQEILKKYGIT
ncbi:MAG: phosphoenolpyruvate--protein phosphotransferase [Ruminococcus sp.]|nr:phosphoenolpyruvate--protein phosphotransferase [Ruminococcus sp.]